MPRLTRRCIGEYLKMQHFAEREGEAVFLALELVESKQKGIFGFLSNILTKPTATWEEAEACGVRYGLVRAPRTRTAEPNWTAIAQLVGRFADRVLLPDDLVLPPQSPLAPFCCPRFEQKVLLATACEIIKRTRMPMYRRIVGLIDPDGDYTDYLPVLLRHYTTVRVITENLQEYERAAAEMMDQLGAPVLIGTAPSILAECVLVVAPGRTFNDAGTTLPCPVLAGEQFDPPFRCHLISGLQAGGSPELAAQTPSGISPHRFAAALYEDSGVLPTGGFVAGKMLLDYKISDLPEVVRAVMQAAGTLFLF